MTALPKLQAATRRVFRLRTAIEQWLRPETVPSTALVGSLRQRLKSIQQKSQRLSWVRLRPWNAWKVRKMVREEQPARPLRSRYRRVPNTIPLLDLHGLNRPLARAATSLLIDRLCDPQSPLVYVRLVVGMGHHSRGGKRVLAPEAQALLKSATALRLEPGTETAQRGWFDVYHPGKRDRYWGLIPVQRKPSTVSRSPKRPSSVAPAASPTPHISAPRNSAPRSSAPRNSAARASAARQPDPPRSPLPPKTGPKKSPRTEPTEVSTTSQTPRPSFVQSLWRSAQRLWKS